VIAEANRTIQFLSSLPADLALKTVLYYSNKWHISVHAESADALLKQFKPLPVALTGAGTWVSPFYLVPSDSPPVLADGTLQTLPFTVSDPKNQGPHIVDWHAQLALPEYQDCPALDCQVRITVEGCLTAPTPAGYTATSVGSSTARYILRRTVSSVAVSDRSPLAQFEEKKDTFLKSLNLNAAQMQFANVVGTVAQATTELRVACLPAKVGNSVELAKTGATRGNPESDKYSKGSTLYALARVGVFWDYFTAEQATKLLEGLRAIAAEVSPDMPVKEAQDKYIPKIPETAAAQANDWIKANVESSKSPIQPAMLEYLVQMQSGHDIAVSSRGARHHHDPKMMTHDFWLHFQKWNGALSVDMPRAYDEDGFDWLNPSFVACEPIVAKEIV
jgi:hypothetical protein